MPVREQIHDLGRRRAWVIWVVSLAVYMLAVFHRSSLGVAGLMAAERFHIDATRLAFFTVLQLVVYAGMQIPVGVMLDRFGSRRLLLAGLVGMTGGIGGFYLAASLGWAKQATGSYQSGLLAFAGLALLALACLTGVKARWRQTWGAQAAGAQLRL